MKKYPKQVFIQKEKENDDKEYLLAWEEAEEANDGEIAIYTFVKVMKKSTKTILQ